MSQSFVHLHLHSEFSLVDGIVRIKPLIKSVVENAMPAVAITDQANMFAVVKFYNAALSGGVKPIFGVDVNILNDDDHHFPHKVVMLAQNQAGYNSLKRLVSKSYIEGQHLGIPMINKQWLTNESEGIITLSGGRNGDIGQALIAGNMDLANQLLDFWQPLYDDRFYLELQRTGRENEEHYIHAAVELAISRSIPVVATNDVRFLKAENYDAHETRICIHEGRVLDDPRRPKIYSDQQYFRTTEEMVALFHDLPEAIENTIEIAKRCSVKLRLGENYLPDFPIPKNKTIGEFFVDESNKGLEKRLSILLDRESTTFETQRIPYDERLKIELDVILQMGFPGYFLIVADFIQWAKDNGIPVGPGRGSGAGSLVAYALQITDLDPLEYELLFERFLNPERVSMPDFDIDFCMDGRDRVIDYVARKYGRQSVSQIITYGTMTAKAVVRDVGRVMGHPYGMVDKIAKLIPFEIGITLIKALEQSEELKEKYDNDEEVKNLLDMAKTLEGVTRNAGKHAGGVVISPTILTDFAPLYCEQGGGNLVTQFDKNDVESVGLVKFDFLGLRTLTIIDWALKNIKISHPNESQPDISRIPLDDPKSFDLLKNCETTAVFQLESRGMKDLIRRLQPDCFDEIIALVALFRPGPLGSGMVDDFINRKHGRAEIEYPHPDLEPILKPTYGVILYQEQVMQIAQVLARYSLGGADLLRRAMGKKKAEEMAKQRDTFLSGTKENGIDSDQANYIFDLMEKFAGYGFNKSHSAAYALVAYQTAWLKAHYPAEFMAAVLSSDMDNTDKVVTFIDDCRENKIKLQPPDVNQSDYPFTVNQQGNIIYGLGAIKGVGLAAIEGIIDNRRQNGRYLDMLDFCQRVELGKVNKRVLESLIKAGAVDELGENRATLSANLPTIIQAAEQHKKVTEAGQFDMFGFGNTSTTETKHDLKFPSYTDWDEEQRLLGEKETLGLYLTGHPIDRYLKEIKHFVSAKIADLEIPASTSKYNRGGVPVTVSGLIVNIRTRQNQKGTRMAFLTLDDRSGRLEINAFSEAYAKYQHILQNDKIVVVTGAMMTDEYSGGIKVNAEHIYDIDQAREKYAKTLSLSIDYKTFNHDFLTQLSTNLSLFLDGNCPICIKYKGETAKANLILGDEWRAQPTDELIKRLNQLIGQHNVQIGY